MRRDGTTTWITDAGTWWRRIAPGTKDVALAVMLTAATQVELFIAEDVQGPLAAQSLAFAAMTVSVAFRRSRPLITGALAGGGIAAQTFAGSAEVVGGFIALLIATYSVASYAGLHTALLGGLFVVAGVSSYPLVNQTTFADEVGNLAIFSGAWAMGRAVRSRQLRAQEAEDRVTLVERKREDRLRAVLAEERGRIARELHDIVAHGVSVMTLQAGAARQTLERDPETVRELLLVVEQAGRQSLDEMHRLLGVLRRTDDDLTFAPPLTLSALDQLLADVRSTDLEVTCHVEGPQRPLAAGLEVSAYRIIQQALTNILQHAAARHADVVLRYHPEALEISVTDDGRGSRSDTTSAGHGLVGMRERAELLGGHLIAGPGDGGGWRVEARLPTPEAS